MLACTVLIAVLLAATPLVAQTPRPPFDTFEVATIKPPADDPPGRFMKMENDHRFLLKDYTLKGMIAAAYDLNPKTISGGPSWVESDHFDIVAVTPGTVRPTHDEQMRMLRALLTERFHLATHREKKDFSVFVLEVAKGGPKLKITATPNDPPILGPGVVHPQRVVLPARNATTGELCSILQRAILDRPVVDHTNLTARWDFDLEWAPDSREFGGDVPAASETAPALPLFAAIQQELGLRLEPTHALVDALIVDAVQHPSAN